MDHTPKTTAETASTRKKGVFLPLVFGVTLPIAHVVLLSRFLPDWLDAVIVGIIFWVFFGEIIPSRCAGVFRGKK